MRRPQLRLAALVLSLFLTIGPPAALADDSSSGPLTSGLVAVYAQLLRHINPRLAFSQCVTYAQALIDNAARTHIDPRLLAAVITVESHWTAQAVSPVGARGLGQLMPHTAHSLGVDPRSAQQNMRGTSDYLRRMLDRFGSMPHGLQLAIGAYNAGPNAVIKYKGIPPYHETRAYVKRVLHFVHQLDGRYTLDVSVPDGDGTADDDASLQYWTQ